MGLLSRQKYSVSILLVLIPLALSAYTHLWNPAGFPNLFYDEGVYMRRAMHVMEGLGPQEAYYYDHPFFGQIFLGSILMVVGYPQSLSPSADLASIGLLYEVPRTLMGLLAIIDTFLIYKISERLYNRNVALFASVLFAVMPTAWFTRMILLDSILLPFLLSSILLALHTRTSKSDNGDSRKNNYNNNILIVLSGILLGTAIFTKIPAFTIIPLIAFVIYRNNGRTLKVLVMWFIPVIAIPLLWPAQSLTVGTFSSWTSDVLWQINRENAGLPWIVFLLAITDPFIFVVGFAGLVYSFIRRDLFILLWMLPFMTFLGFMGYTNFFYWIPVLPALCIGAAKLILDMIEKTRKITQRALTVAVLSSIVGFGLVSTTLLIVTDVTSAQLETAAYASRYLEGGGGNEKNLTVISNPVYSWVLKYVFEKDNIMSDYRDLLFFPIDTSRSGVLLIDDPRFNLDMRAENNQLLRELQHNTSSIANFEGKVTNFDLGLYPYTSMIENYEGSEVTIRLNNSLS